METNKGEIEFQINAWTEAISEYEESPEAKPSGLLEEVVWHDCGLTHIVHH